MILIVLLNLFMNFSFNQKDFVSITAHRGASGYAPENTMSAFTTAIIMGSNYIELDAQETSDGEIIILHDNTLERTTGINKNIWEVSYSEIKNLDAGYWFNEKFKNEPIPKLSDVINNVNGKIKLNIELKTNGHEKKLAEKVVKIVETMKFTSDCILTSFDFSQIRRVKELNPNIKVGYILKSLPENIDVFKSDIEILSVHYNLVNNEFMEKAIKNNKEVHVWTVNDEDEMKRIIDLGVNNIITNYPDKLKEILGQIKN